MSAGAEPRRATSRTPRLTPALVVVTSVAVLAVVGAGTSGGWFLFPRVWFAGRPLTTMPTPPQVSPPVHPPPLQQSSTVQQWVAGILTALMAGLVLVGLVYLVRWLWRHRPRRAVVEEEKPESTPAGVLAAEPDLPTLLRGAQRAESILARTDGEPRDLVMLCWVALEEAAGDSGVRRRPADSPTEFTSAVLRATRADPASVQSLLALYHRARFSSHPITDGDVRAARTAVIRLAGAWRDFDTAMRHTARRDL